MKELNLQRKSSNCNVLTLQYKNVTCIVLDRGAEAQFIFLFFDDVRVEKTLI